MGPVNEEDKRKRSLGRNHRDCSSCERSRLHFLRMALGALQLAPVHLQSCRMPPGESCHPRLPGAWRQRAEEPAPDIRRELKGWLGVPLCWRQVLLGNLL
uniref:Uncharacterized protein n=1 Tax=Aotus nancymaae TaxID=37293 RepID=A0A2K5DGD6_AOTNA